MSAGAPWSVKGIDPKAREVAKDLARRSGMTLGEWLNRVILEDDLPEDLTAETQFSDRLYRGANGAPRLMALAGGGSDFNRVAASLDRLTDRIEASETRTGLAINAVEHSIRQTLARIETTEREQHGVALRVDGALSEIAAEQTRHTDRLRRLEGEGGPRSAEALRALETRVAQVEPDALAEDVLQRLGDRLAMAEARTAAALEELKHSLGALDSRMGSVERSGKSQTDLKFEAFSEVLTHRLEAVRSEVAQKLAASAGPQVEARLAAMAETVRAAERRSTEAVEAIGRQVLTMAEAVGQKLSDVDQRSAEAIDQVGSEVARIAGAVELRLARGEQLQAEGFERLTAELSKVTEAFGQRLSDVQTPAADTALQDVAELAAEAAPPEPVAEAPIFGAPEFEPEPSIAALLEEARQRLGPPLDPESEPETSAAAFGEELFSRAEVDDVAGETVEAPWRRLDLEVPDGDIPEIFAPLNEADDDLFEPTPAAGPELSTREVIDRARAAARAAGSEAHVDVSARVDPKKATGGLFQGFGARLAPSPAPEPAPKGAFKPPPGMGGGLLEHYVRKAGQGNEKKANRFARMFGIKSAAPPSGAMQTALMIAGGAAFLSVGAAGLTLMQPAAPPPEDIAQLSPGQTPRAAVALTRGPSYDEIRADVEAGVPGALDQLRTMSNRGEPRAQLYLAQLYDLGEAGLARDPVEARRLIGLAAEAGDIHAMHNLAVFQFRGEGGAQDLASAAQWFRKAAEAGVVESQYNLGLLYRTGSGVPKDLAEARFWFQKAAEGGDPEARDALAELAPPPTAKAPPAARTATPPVPRRAFNAPLASQNVRQTQLILARLGYYEGPADGLATDAYKTALSTYQRDLNDARAGPRPYAQR